MRNYDFLILSPDEFELFSRDLLQKQLNITLETFKSGKDQGVDARYSTNCKNGIIVQAKRYKDFSPLIGQLNKEALKINKLKPNRYILTTSVSLNPSNKKTISNILKPFIRNESDILGRDDLNNLLNKYPEVEQDYYKLWISSTDILQKILHNRVYTQTLFDYDDIKLDIQKYVSNPSLSEADKLLKAHRVVVISGIPGIGKTTLAKALAYKLLATSDQYVEFVSLGQNITDAFDVFERNKAQLFFFDDFLGSNFLVNNLDRNEDKNIIQFIQKINQSNNKYLICTTREYILQQAKQSYEKINKNDLLEISKYVVDLETYTSLIKAKILYNHLFFSNLTEPYFNEVILDKNYLKIIKHQNFNPRIIELITKDRFANSISPKQYISKIESYLNNPEEIWNDAYGNQISELAQIILLIITTCDAPIIYEDLFDATEQYTKRNWQGLYFNSSKFDKALKELENTFIKIRLDKIGYKEEDYIVEFQNPSIQDFLHMYITNHTDHFSKLLPSFIYLNQFFHLFSLKDDSSKVKIPNKLYSLLNSKIIGEFSNLKFSTLIKTVFPTKSEAYLREEPTILNKIEYLIRNIDLNTNVTLRSYLLKTFLDFPYERIADHNLERYVRIAEQLKVYKPQVNYKQMLVSVLGNLNSVSNLNVFFSFQNICPQEFNQFLSLNKTVENISSIIKSELSDAKYNYTSANDLSEFVEDVKKASENYDVILNSKLDDLEEEVRNLEAAEDENYDYWQDTQREEEDSREFEEKKELEAISNLFDSLDSTLF